MTLYKLGLELLSPIITPLKGDTIWGHIVWGIAHNEGEEAVKDFLAESKEKPQLIVSSAFPSGYICLPLPEPQKRTEKPDIETYSAIKKNKKHRYEAASRFLSGGCTEKDRPDRIQSVFTAVPVMHNSINRYSNTVIEGNLFSVTEQWPNLQDKNKFKDKSEGNAENKFDLYVLSDFSAQRVLQLCTWAFENGYGADASTGKGHIRIVQPPETVTPLKSGHTYCALAPFVGYEGDGITDLRADIFVRIGKIGGGFSGFMSPYKKPVVLYDEGAVFKSDKPIEYAGRLLTNVHSDSRICQAGFAPVIPIE